MFHLTIDGFTADIQQLKYSLPELDSVAYYVAGAAKQNLKFDLNVEIILRFLGEVVQALHNDEITADQRTDIEFSIYRGLLAEARKKLTSYKQISQKKRVVPDVTCKICMDPIPKAELLPLENCGDVLHKACMAQYLNVLINDRKFPLVCPLPECRREINVTDITERLEPADFARFTEFSFNDFVQTNMQDMTCCPTPNCSYVFSKQCPITMFVCPSCEHVYCLECKCSYHKGESCEQYQRHRVDESNEQAFIEYARGAKFKQCARCTFWVERIEGCPHMRCRCGYEFCYLCGGKYLKCACQAGAQRPGVVRR
jgi:ariadne-1